MSDMRVYWVRLFFRHRPSHPFFLYCSIFNGRKIKRCEGVTSSLARAWRPNRRSHAHQKQCHEYYIAVTHERRRREGDWETRIQGVTQPQSEARTYATMRIDHGRYAAVRSAHNWQALLDRAYASDQEMLHRTGIGTKPRIVGHIDQPAWTGFARHLARKDDLVANERTDGRRARDHH